MMACKTEGICLVKDLGEEIVNDRVVLGFGFGDYLLGCGRGMGRGRVVTSSHGHRQGLGGG